MNYFWKRALSLSEEKTLLSLFKVMGLPERSGYRMVNAGKFPPADKAVLLARHLGTSVEYLASQDGGMKCPFRPGSPCFNECPAMVDGVCTVSYQKGRK